ncbi:MAG: hypothetical protein AB8B91_00715 [Rubripirellula sp.]
MNSKTVSCLILIVATTCGGCGVEPETLESLRGAVNTVSAQSGNAALPSDTEKNDSLAAQYEPPHPERTDPFAFASEAPVNDFSTTINSSTNVEVLGFAHVRERRVFLRLKGQTHSLTVGGIASGVQVVAIREPVVELKMGNLVWTATMFDGGSPKE